MSEDLFSFIAERLEARTPLDRPASRGTLRIVLKHAGLDLKAATQEQYCVVLERVLPGELECRGVAEAQAICADLIEQIQTAPADRWDASHDVDKIFDRLAGT